jgi:hypothetical protein
MGGSGTGYAQGQSPLPDGPLVARTIETPTFEDFSGGRSATLMATSAPGALPTTMRTVATDTGFSHNVMTRIERFRSRLAVAMPPPRATAPAGSPAPPPAMSREASLTILDRVDLKRKLALPEYDRRLGKAQGRLGQLVRTAFEKKRSSVVVFEG